MKTIVIVSGCVSLHWSLVWNFKPTFDGDYHNFNKGDRITPLDYDAATKEIMRQGAIYGIEE